MMLANYGEHRKCHLCLLETEDQQMASKDVSHLIERLEAFEDL
jgi:hypothetical protein